ncbi:MAG: glycosyltransferase [Flavobacteriaceae bacterium]
MKILQIIDQLEVGGAEKVLVDLTNIMHEHMQDVTVLCLLSSAVLETQLNNGVEVIYLNRRNKYNPFTLLTLYKHLKRHDIIHVHCRQVMRYVGLLLFLPKPLRPFKIVFHDHYGKIASDTNIDFLLKTQLKKINAYIGVSAELVNWYNGLVNNNSGTLLSNIVRASAIQEKKQLSPRCKKIVMVGNFRPQKKYEFALSLLASLPENYILTIIGAVVDSAYYKRILNLATQLDIPNRLTIKTNVTETRSELLKYDMAIHTAQSETGPLVAIEYLSVNLPFVMYDTGQVAKQIQPELSDFVMTSVEVDAWKDRIALILENKDSYSPKINSIFRQNFSEENYFQECLKVYQNL